MNTDLQPESLSGPSSEGDFVTKLLLPMLLHEVNNATQLLVGLRALLELPGGEAMFAKRADDLARTSKTMDDLGFAMAVLATAGGANMLMARRERRGIAILWDLARRSLQRTGGDALQHTGEIPELAPSALDGWQVPWASAALMLSVPNPTSWSWRWDADGTLHGTCGDGAPEDESLARIRERVPGSEIHAAEGEIRWNLPLSWLGVESTRSARG